jgi:two-component system NtrC family sensor kinase
MPIISRIADAVAESLRYKLLLLVLFPLLLLMPAIMGLTIYWSYNFTYDQLYAKVNTDLSVSHDVFMRLQRDFVSKLAVLGESYSFRVAYSEGDMDKVEDQLAVLEKTSEFDYLYVVDTNGLRRSGKAVPAVVSPRLGDALEFSRPGVGVQIMFPEELEDEAVGLAEKVAIPLIQTPRAAPTSRTMENRGMVIRAFYPLKNTQGIIRGALVGGVLLNNNFAFVDRIRDLVYGPGSVPEDGWGTVTVFLDDVRISTNVPLDAGERALGTRVSQEVRDRVLDNGQNWVDRSFVVNDWYISAYEPIVDTFGDRVGMLYAGFLEAPYANAYMRTITLLVVALLLVAIFTALLLINRAKQIFKPVETMSEVVKATQAGEDRRIGVIQSKDEIGELARQFDNMLMLLNERNSQIRRAAQDLEHKVQDRTRELEDRNVDLQKTIDLLQEARQQLAMAEKFAALGELTAGVAHEINNPTAVILGNVDVMIRELGPNANSVRTETDLVIEQVYRIRAIVDRLLRYARPSAFAASVEPFDVDEAIQGSLTLVGHELEKSHAVLEKDLAATNPISMDRLEFQQILVNLLLNASQAVSPGGRIELRTRDDGDRGVFITVKDHGVGVPVDELQRIFDPFYTRKRGGTGLGLSVSYGLVRRYGGQIKVESEEGSWTCFTLQLLRVPVFEEDDPLPRQRHAGGA